MKTMSIRDLRQRWPEAEAALQIENEIIITRDSKPVAKLICFSDAPGNRPRWNAKAHADWQKKISGGHISRSDAALAKSRAERVFSPAVQIAQRHEKRAPRKKN
ncbi:MAG TPA: hypothetical protein VNV43_07155 [Candidatus Acidoferrales bacterium]|jgi:antitoxin (DNA-binding transcriptional repressor) of toxin-antitoxin stability system|nr:hypothetical protein [Candidatus Acidoferrales bacterium]